MPRFSICIPTLGRADTLRHTLATALGQLDADVEIVVQNNGDDVATRALVERLGDARIHHFSSETVLSLTENWELALSNCSGRWITFVGDDDGLLPDACAIAAQVLEAGGHELLSWAPFLYLWPQYFDERRRNRLEATIDFRFTVTPTTSRPLLRRFYDFEVHYSRLPMIYNSFVKASVIDRVRARHGRYFFGAAPDVTSGIVNAAFCDRFLKLTRPLSISGISQHSTGHNVFIRSENRPSRGEFERDFPMLRDGGELPGAASNLELCIAADMLLLKEHVLQADETVVLSHRNLLRTVAAAINTRPAQYEETKALIEESFRRFAIDPADVPIPAKLSEAPIPPAGVEPLGSDQVRFWIDGDAIGLRSIADAVNLVAQLVPSGEKLVWSAPAETAGEIPVLSADPLTFAKNGNGVEGLVSGWADPEAWGTWSVGRESLIRISIPGATAGRARLGLRYRTIPSPDGTPRVVECTVDGATTRWEFRGAGFQGEVVVEVSPTAPSETIALMLVNVNPRSPAELGLGADARQLGIGVEQIRLLDPDSRTRPVSAASSSASAAAPEVSEGAEPDRPARQRRAFRP